jgi:hypothetical protein
MRRLKSLLLLTLAIGLLASMSSSPAFATGLCTKDQWGYCQRLGVGSQITMGEYSYGATKFTAEHFYVECGKNTLRGTVRSAGGSGMPVRLEINQLSYSSCYREVVARKLGSLEVQSTWEPDGRVSGTGTEIEFNYYGLKCNYVAGSGAFALGGTLAGGSPATLRVEGRMSRVAGPEWYCGQSIGLVSYYQVDYPYGLYVSYW